MPPAAALGTGDRHNFGPTAHYRRRATCVVTRSAAGWAVVGPPPFVSGTAPKQTRKAVAADRSTDEDHDGRHN